MAWTGLALTVDGRVALNNAQLANKMNIKSIVIGDGNTPANFRTLKGLVHQLYEISELKIDVSESDGTCMITADIPKVDYDYYFREIGVIVDTEEGEKLYVYDNCGDDAQYIITSTGVESTRKRIRLSLKISDVAEITVSNQDILYISYAEFEEARKELEADIKSGADALDVHAASKANPHNVTKAQVGLGNVNNTADADKPVSTAQQTALDAYYEQTTGYTDQKIADLIGGAPDTLDTLGEIANAMKENEDVVKALNAAIGSKANEAEFDSYKKATDAVLGNTDISGIGDGTLTGAVRVLNTGLAEFATGTFVVNTVEFSYIQYGRLVIATALTNYAGGINLAGHIDKIISAYVQRNYDNSVGAYNPAIRYTPGISLSILLDTSLGSQPKATAYFTVIGLRE